MKIFGMKKILLTVVVIAAASPVIAQTYQPAQSSAPIQMAAFTDPANVRADLARIDGAMNATKSFSGRFVQYSPNGAVDQGQIYLRRPENLRFEYDAPNPLLIVADNGMLVQHDKALETYDRVPLSATPLSYFPQREFKLGRGYRSRRLAEKLLRIGV